MAATSQRKATFVAEPLERGFGLTLGNALRRVLLSSPAGRRDHLDQDRERAARILVASPACAKTSPTSCST
jgi:hypothetical protein